uniref:Non-specific serine/threonine protein kinase n=1 Tax=Strigamia maritima TaxID=126957 RepID=T1J2L4_STRMM
MPQQEGNSEKKILSNPNRRSDKMEAEIENKKTEAEEASRRVSNLEENEKHAQSKISHLQKLLDAKLDELNSVKNERDTNERHLAKCVNEVTKLRRFLEFEQNERKLNEKKALQLISDMKEKWKREEDNLKTELQKQESYVANFEPKIFESKTKEIKYQKLVETMGKELKEAKMMMEQYRLKVGKMMENKKERVSEVHVMLEEISTEKDVEIGTLKHKLNKMADNKTEFQEKLLKTEKILKQKEELLSFMEKERECFVLSETETEEKLKTLQEKCLLLEEKLSDYENNSREYGAREFAFQELQKCLTEEQEVTRIMQEKIELIEKNINSTIATQSSALANMQDRMSAEIQGLAHEKKEVDNIKLKLERDLQDAQVKQQELNKQIEELKSIISNKENEKQSQIHEAGDNQTVSKKERESDSRAQMSKLQTQLDRAREVSSTERQRTRESQEELRKVQKENSDIKLDLRISQRELKKATEQITTLENTIKTLDSNYGEVQNRLSEMRQKEDQLQDKLKNIEVELGVKKQELERAVERAEAEKSKLESRIQELDDVNQVSGGLQSQVDKLQYQNEELGKQKLMLEDQIKLMEELKQQQRLDETSVRSELEALTIKHKKVENNLNLLKSTCIVLEGQLKDFEILVENYEAQEETLKNEKESFDEELNNLEDQLASTKRSLAQEISRRESLERERDQLQHKLDTAKAVQAAESNTLKAELDEQKAAVIQYNDELNDTEQKLITAERARKNYQQRSETYERESRKIKEEAAELITQVNSLRDSNLKLTVGLGEAIEKCEVAKEQFNELESVLESEQMTHRVEKVRLQATIDQQSKLINFLQSQTEGKKKKTLQEKIFGRYVKPTASTTMSEKDKQATNQRVKIEYSKPNENEMKPPTPKTLRILPVITQSPGVQRSPDGDEGVNSKLAEERMRHNIPHRFQNCLNLRATKCATCLDTIHFGRGSSKCQECNLTVHPKCAPSIPSTCGLPTGFYQHFRQSLRTSSRRRPYPKPLDKNCKGWVKIPRGNKMSWERKFAIIEDSILNVYDSDDMDSSPVDSVNLCPIDGETVVHGAVTPAELQNTAKSDLAYILKLEMIPQTTCWPSKTLYLLAPSFGDKQTWFNALDSATKEHSAKSKKIKEAKLLGSVVLHADEDNILDVNCLIHLNSNLVLIGAEEGLFYMEIEENKTKKNPQKILGVNSVFQLELIEHLNTIIMIINHERALCHVIVTEILSAIKNNLQIEPVLIEDLTSCHLFAHGRSNQTTFLCVAGLEKVYLCKFDNVQKAFCLQKAFMSADPCSCLLFTKNSVIVGSDKFFEIDLKNLTVEDTSDYAVVVTTQANSFPVNVLKISKSDEEDEFLLCFHEFGLFVDGYGSRSRKGDLKWTRLPLSFAYQPPYLFITHFNSIEIVELQPSPINGKRKSVFLDVNCPRYLNKHPSISGCIYLASNRDQSLDIFCLQGNLAIANSELETDGIQEDCTIDTETVCNSSLSEFSFSSSVMNIIEAVSDTESSEYSHMATPRDNIKP